MLVYGERVTRILNMVASHLFSRDTSHTPERGWCVGGNRLDDVSLERKTVTSTPAISRRHRAHQGAPAHLLCRAPPDARPRKHFTPRG